MIVEITMCFPSVTPYSVAAIVPERHNSSREKYLSLPVWDILVMCVSFANFESACGIANESPN